MSRTNEPELVAGNFTFDTTTASSAQSNCRPDSDGDGVDDGLDAFPNDPCCSTDTDRDGMPDRVPEHGDEESTSDPPLVEDPDDDDDGVSDEDEASSDPASDPLDVDTDDSSDDAPRGSLALDDHEPPSPLPPPPKRRARGVVDEIDLFASDSEAGDGSPGGCAPSLKLPPPPSPSQTDDEEEIDVPPDNRFAKYAQYKSPLRARADGMKWWEKPI